MGAILGLLANAGVDLVSKFIDTGKDKAVEVIKDKTGIDLSKKNSLNPAEIAKLKEFQEKNREFLIKQIELANEDRANARAMQKVALNQGSWLAKNFIYLFATIWSVFAMVYIGFITFYTIPQASQRFADTILGFLLGTIVSAIIQFFYGSSMGSKNKDEILKQKGIK
jgi:hypothetical protein